MIPGVRRRSETMPLEEKERSRYYQEIAAVFFKQRGGPFLLSPKDLATIAGWEAMGVPLEAAREGIVQAFEHSRTGPSVRRTIRTLAACQSQVLKAFDRFRDRGVGRPVKAKSRDEKRAAMIAEARRFLRFLPEPVSFLKDFYEEALDLLGKGKPDEDALERLEAKVERLLAERGPAQDKADVRRALAEEFPWLGAKEADRVFDLKLIKSLRVKYQIPYITFPFY